MADRPINLRDWQVRAGLDGRLSALVVLIKPQPDITKISPPFHPEHRGGRAWVFMARDDFPGYSYATGDFVAPYAPGDRLWVRETFQVEPSGCGPVRVIYAADLMDARLDFSGNSDRIAHADRLWTEPDVCRPSIHMPRWASRLTLLVTDVRVQRLCSISSDDVAAEGVERGVRGCGGAGDYRSQFADLWNSINGPDAWAANPWVAAVSFEVHRRNIDQMEARQCA